MWEKIKVIFRAWELDRINKVYGEELETLRKDFMELYADKEKILRRERLLERQYAAAVDQKASMLKAQKAETATQQWYDKLPATTKEETLRTLRAAHPTVGLVKVMKELLQSHRHLAHDEAMQPNNAGKPEAIHAMGGSFWLSVVEMHLVNLVKKVREENDEDDEG